MSEAIRIFIPWFMLNGFFVAFWIFTLLAFVSTRASLKNAYLVFFFVSMAMVGLVIGAPVWPFHQWHLWGRMLPRVVEYHEVWLEDDRGQEFPYDLRATPPLVTSYLNKKHAPEMARAAENGQPDGRAVWLLAMANTYQPTSSVGEWFRFELKDHSHYLSSGLYENSRISPRWPEDHGYFRNLLIKKKRATFQDAPGCGAEFELLRETRIP